MLISRSPKECHQQSDFLRWLVEQTVTSRFCCPTLMQSLKAVIERCGLTYKEFVEGLKQMAPDSRMFMARQNRKSSLAKLDSYGFSEEMAALSGNAANVPHHASGNGRMPQRTP